MKLNLVLPLFFCLFSHQVLASTKQVEVVYGEDGRVEAFERPALSQQSQAVAAMIPSKELSLETMIGFQIEAPSYEQAFNLCRGDKLAAQPVLAECTGFLVAPDVLMTAGHCVRTFNDCQSADWVFGYEMNPRTGNPQEIDRNNVYQCKSIISQSSGNGDDYAVIRLDRKANRMPLKLSPSMSLAAPGTALTLIGYPSGLPLKITEGGQVLRAEGRVLVTNLDAFSGNSGSPVFDARTNLVVGILVSGNDDFVESSRGCSVTNKMEMNQGGETVTAIAAVPRTY